MKTLPHSFFIHDSGKIILPHGTPPTGSYYDHLWIPLNQPEDFKMSDRQIEDITGLFGKQKEEFLSSGSGESNSSAIAELSRRGYHRVNYTTIKRENEPTIHKITISPYKSRKSLNDLIPAIHQLRSSYIHLNPMELHLDGLKFHDSQEVDQHKKILKPEHLKSLKIGSLRFTNSNDIDRFLAIGSKMGRDPGSGVDTIPSASEIISKMGPRPEGIPPSIWRGYGMQSDSYFHILGFKQYLKEFKV